MDKTNSIMVLGKPNSGKTVYSAQLYGRLTRGVEQQIAIRNTPENLDIFQEALERLAEGNHPQRTTSSQFANVSLPLIIKNEKEVDLTWFDYAGEQLTHIFESRSVNEKWAETLINANGWMVFIRLNDETKYKHKMHKFTIGLSKNQKNGLSKGGSVQLTHKQLSCGSDLHQERVMMKCGKSLKKRMDQAHKKGVGLRVDHSDLIPQI